MYLLDTDIVLRLRTARATEADRPLVAWASATPRQGLFLSALTVMEVERLALAGEGKGKTGANGWRDWIDNRLLPAFEGRVLAVDGEVAARAARLNYTSTRDALVAATSLRNNLVLVTPRPGAFRSGKVKLLDPWNYDPEDDAGADWRAAARGSSLWLKTLFVRG